MDGVLERSVSSLPVSHAFTLHIQTGVILTGNCKPGYCGNTSRDSVFVTV